MGRKPFKTDVRMKQFTHWLDPEVMALVKERVGGMKMSEFVREAIEEKLASSETRSPNPQPKDREGER